ncbi:MAG: Cas10/Cmr2 second palm domain-containing protein [Pseudonocardiaceae bacterium]
MRVDLVLLSLGGVQRFIAESRSTADVAGASRIVQSLAKCAATVVDGQLAGAAEPCGLIFPATVDALSVTNKIVFLAPERAGPGIARAAAEEISQTWRTQLEQAFRPDQPPDAPGMPDVAWVSVTGPVAEGGYGMLWQAAQEEMDGRKRARVFEPFEIRGRTLCAQSPGLPAVKAPKRSRRHERDEALSAAGWAKRQAGRTGEAFPSTVSIASSVFRSRLLEHAAADPDLVAELRDPVGTLVTALTTLDIPGDHATLRSVPVPDGLEPLAGRLGAWVSAERWNPDALAGEYGTRPDAELVRGAQRAAGAITAIARKAGIQAPSPYFAVVVQDLDRLGRALGTCGLNQQREVSRQLSALAAEQRALIKAQHPRVEVVYTGGDDLLAFCPAADALTLARSIREQVRDTVSTGLLATAGRDGGPITASTGVVFAHMSNPLQDAVRSAQEAIKKAKEAKRDGGRSRDAFAVVVRRRGGERARTVLPWWPGADPNAASAMTLLDQIRPGPESGALSGALGSDLERDKQVLSDLGATDEALLRAELIRLVARHGGTKDAGDALCTLGLAERGVHKGRRFEPVPAALVARFLSQEAR